jgi:hypothetical protein
VPSLRNGGTREGSCEDSIEEGGGKMPASQFFTLDVGRRDFERKPAEGRQSWTRRDKCTETVDGLMDSMNGVFDSMNGTRRLHEWSV